MEYNPQKEYTWEKEDVFEIKGTEFHILLNNITAFCNSPISLQSMARVMDAQIVLQNMLVSYVNNDLVKEKTEPKPAKTMPLKTPVKKAPAKKTVKR